MTIANPHVNNTGQHASQVCDAEYHRFLDNVCNRFTSLVMLDKLPEPIFRADVPKDALWDAYINSFPAADQAQHNCNACRSFIQNFGGLVIIDHNCEPRSVFWGDEEQPAGMTAPTTALKALVESAHIDTVFVTEDATLGHDTHGPWYHLHVELPAVHQWKRTDMEAHQFAAQKKQDYKAIIRALTEFKLPLLQQAVAILNTDRAYRGEKVLGPAQWLHDVQELASTKTRALERSAAVWRAVAVAPDGFLHPRSSMIGTLLEDLEKGKSYDMAMRNFAAKMHPAKYATPVAAPKAGAITVAEKQFEKLGAASALQRRHARLDEVQTIWSPAEPVEAKPSLFGHLKTQQPTAQALAGYTAIGFLRFMRDVLPDAVSIQVVCPSFGYYAGTLTAAVEDSIPILQWDSEQQRNPFSEYTYTQGSNAFQWSVLPGLNKVTGVMLSPHQWYGGDFKHFGSNAMFLIEGAVDKALTGSCLFPQYLRSEYHSMRSVIEAHSKSAVPTGKEQAGACGLNYKGAVVHVTNKAGITSVYQIDRWE